jgi:DNA modification methylase
MFAGSGSTIMACEQTKRIGFSMELDPHYVDAICRRFQGATGKKAMHAKEKKDFEAIAEARGKA